MMRRCREQFVRTEEESVSGRQQEEGVEYREWRGRRSCERVVQVESAWLTVGRRAFVLVLPDKRRPGDKNNRQARFD